MGRLTTTSELISDSVNISGTTNINSYTFIDESGNVTQINKKSKSRLKYYIDDKIPQPIVNPPCVIGISGNIDDPDCELGIGLGLGDNQYGLANYKQ